MPIDKSPPWKAVSWAEKYPDDKTEKTVNGLYYWTIMNDAGYTICSDWMTEEQARIIAAAPELRKALEDCLMMLEIKEKVRRPEWDKSASPTSVIGEARAALAKATVSP